MSTAAVGAVPCFRCKCLSSSASISFESRSADSSACFGSSSIWGNRLALPLVSEVKNVGGERRGENGVRAQGLESPAQPVADFKVVRLGKSDVYVPRLGVGSWSWGDVYTWHEDGWDDRKAKEAKAAFETSLDAGIPFFDTAEVYGKKLIGGGEDSETLLGRFIKERQRAKPQETTKVVIATKFAPLPWRFGRGSVVSALKDSLQNLGVSQIDLYQLHWPGLWGNEGFIDGLADAVELGLVKAVGVSNYKESRLRDAYAQLQKRGVTLASNQVHYNLVYRNPEENGVKKACEDLGVSLIAYSPLAQGVLTGKYSPTRLPSGSRARVYNEQFMTEIDPLINRLKEIGQQYGGKTPTQVALNWLVTQGNVIPIPGAKSGTQAQEFAGALEWNLSESEVEELRALARRVKPVTGFPAEWI